MRASLAMQSGARRTLQRARRIMFPRKQHRRCSYIQLRECQACTEIALALLSRSRSSAKVRHLPNTVSITTRLVIVEFLQTIK